MRIKDLLVAALIVSLAGGSRAWAQESGVVVDRAAIEQALAARSSADDAKRATIHAFLSRAEVRELAAEMGLDLRRADGAVSTLEPRDLARVADRAAMGSELLTGGAQTIQISLVSLLLIIIIVILLAN